MSQPGKELLFSITKKDFDIQTFRSGGKGGQHQNTTDSGVRIIHRESGAVGESRSEKSQAQNRKIAFRRLLQHPKWITWFKIKCSQELMTKEQEEFLEQKVKNMMTEKNLKIEEFKNGKWVEIEKT